MKKEVPVKVLMIIWQFNRGGLESRLMDIIKNIDFGRVQVDIFTHSPEKGVMDEEAEQYGCKIYYNPPLTIRNALWYVNYFSSFLKEHKEYRIIHAHQDAWCSVFCKGAYLAGVPVRIAHSRTAISTLTLKNIVKNIIKLPARKYATHYFAVSEEAGRWLFGSQRVKRGQVQVWKNAIPCRSYTYQKENMELVRKEFGITDEIVIMHVGNFTPPKNHGFILDVFEQVLKGNPKAKLVLVGGGTGSQPAVQRAVETAAAKGISDRILFLGTRKDVSRLLQMADVFFFPSVFEGLPGAVLEAQAAGIPCVISDSITKEVCVLQSTQRLSLKAPLREWADALLAASKTPKKDTFAQMQQSGFDIDSLVSELTEFYENVEVETNESL